MKVYNRCIGCLGECPDNCSICVFLYCSKAVDFALVEYHIRRDYFYNDFYLWFKQYFKFQMEGGLRCEKEVITKGK